jgi:hypothetical protein
MPDTRKHNQNTVKLKKWLKDRRRRPQDVDREITAAAVTTARKLVAGIGKLHGLTVEDIEKRIGRRVTDA